MSRTHGTKRCGDERGIPSGTFCAMTNTGGGGYQAQSRAAADGTPAGPSMTPGKGPTDRRDVIIAVVALLVVAGVVLALAL